MGKQLDATLAILNGAVGDYLARTKNGLATEMSFIDRGHTLAKGPRIVVLVHGLMCTETVWDLESGGDYGVFLARDLGFTPFYVRYNSGLSIADNGVALD